jgi:hypothetical protein
MQKSKNKCVRNTPHLLSATHKYPMSLSPSSVPNYAPSLILLHPSSSHHSYVPPRGKIAVQNPHSHSKFTSATASQQNHQQSQQNSIENAIHNEAELKIAAVKYNLPDQIQGLFSFSARTTCFCQGCIINKIKVGRRPKLIPCVYGKAGCNGWLHKECIEMCVGTAPKGKYLFCPIKYCELLANRL